MASKKKRSLYGPDAEELGLFKSKAVRVDLATFKSKEGYEYVRFEITASPSSGADALKIENTTSKGVSRIEQRQAALEGLSDGPESALDWADIEARAPLGLRGASVEIALARRESISNAKWAGSEIQSLLERLQSSGALDSWSAYASGNEVGLAAWSALAERADHLVDAGVFECSSGTLWASDPCYEQDASLGVHLDRAQGLWRAYGTRTGHGNWGDRCSSILILREGDDPVPWLAGARRWASAGGCGVDSGQAGFFDSNAFKGSGGSDDKFYNACCDATLGFLGIGSVDKGAVSSSGDGDGGYDIQEARDKSGALLAARILFYEPRPKERLAWRARLARNEAMDLNETVARASRSKKKPGL